MQTRVYLDANATHPLLPEVKAALAKSLMGNDELGNPSSLHEAGRRSKKILNELRKELELASGLKDAHWVLCSGATEALNLALSNAKRESWKVLCSSVEHSAVMKYCEKELPQGFSKISVNTFGVLSLSELESFLSQNKESTSLLVIQTHNNETGLPLLPLAKQDEFLEILSRYPKAQLLVDVVQSLGKTDSRLWKKIVERATYVAASGHKVGALIGVGALWVKPDANFMPQSHGGLQEGGRRAGTEAVWNALSWAEALRVWRLRGELIRTEWTEQWHYIFDALKSMPQVTLMPVDHQNETLSNTLLMAISSKSADLLLQKLDLKGISLSAGSACRSGISQASHVLLALGREGAWNESVIRLSIPANTSQEKIDYFLKCFKESI